MNTVEEMQASLVEADEYIRSQLAHLPAAARDQSASGIIKDLSFAISSMPSLDMSEAGLLNTTINGLTMVADAHKAELVTAVAAKHLAMTVAKPTGDPKMQVLKKACDIFTASDIQVFLDPTKARTQQLEVCGERVKKLCIKNPAEKPTMQHLSAYMCCFLFKDSWPTKQETLNVTLELKEIIKTNGKRLPPNAPHITTYPDDIHSLPAELFQACYGDEPPVLSIPERYREMVGFVKLRKDRGSSQSQSSFGIQNMVQQLLGQAIAQQQGGRGDMPPWLHIMPQRSTAPPPAFSL